MLRILLICAVVSASAMGCSGTPQPRPDTRAAAATRDDRPARPCSPATASRIPAEPGACSPSPGRTYSQTEMEQTGQTNVGDALQMLDPSITVHH
jgi:hypothetical protein